MSNYEIFVDVSADVAPEAAARVHFISMEYSVGESMRMCTGTDSAEDFKTFYNSQRGGDLTKTSQITPVKYCEAVASTLAAGTSVLYLCLSSGLSSTFQSAQMAQKMLKEDYPNVDFIPVDTLGATGGMGVLVERALRNLDAGMSLQDNAADMVYAAQHIRHWFMVQDLMYLKRGGRLSAATAAVGTLLNIKPILQIDKEGRLTTDYKERGFKAAARKLISLFSESYDAQSGDVIYIIHADAEDIAEQLKNEVQALYPQATVRVHYLTPIIGAHTGPNMAAVCYMGK